MTYKLNQGSNAQGEWAELLLNNTKLVRVETKTGEKPVVQVLKPEIVPAEPFREPLEAEPATEERVFKAFKKSKFEA